MATSLRAKQDFLSSLFSGRHLLLNFLFVHPWHRKLGHGGELMEWGENLAMLVAPRQCMFIPCWAGRFFDEDRLFSIRQKVVVTDGYEEDRIEFYAMRQSPLPERRDADNQLLLDDP